MAKALAQKLGIPAYNLDALYWKPGWAETDQAQWRAIQEQLCAGNEWILDGNYGGTLDIRLKHSDTIIFLDLGRFLCLKRALWRSARSHGTTRPDMATGCQEKFDLGFVKWILNYPKVTKPRILKALNALKGEKKVVILSSPKAVKDFLAGI